MKWDVIFNLIFFLTKIPKFNLDIYTVSSNKNNEYI
jgi:hypothetical protein